jgi:hypothetical protein
VRAATAVGIAGVGCAIIACASSAKSSMTGTAPVAPQMVTSDDPKAQIEGYLKKIADAEHDQLNAPATTMAVSACGGLCDPMATKQVKDDATCRPAKTDTCTQMCSLSDSICDNKDRICELATTKLPGDAWAAGKCSDATKSCTDAHARCCDCK